MRVVPLSEHLGTDAVGSVGLGPANPELPATLGHATATMTLDTYRHLFDDDPVAVGDALDKALDKAMRDYCGTAAVSESVSDPQKPP